MIKQMSKIKKKKKSRHKVTHIQIQGHLSLHGTRHSVNQTAFIEPKRKQTTTFKELVLELGVNTVQEGHYNIFILYMHLHHFTLCMLVTSSPKKI